METFNPGIIFVPGEMTYQECMLICVYLMRSADFIRTGKVLTDEQYLDAAYSRLKKAWDYNKYPHPATNIDT